MSNVLNEPLSDRDRHRIERHLSRAQKRLIGPRFWLLFSLTVALALVSAVVWLNSWRQFGVEAHVAGLSRREAVSLVGARGLPLTASEADLVRHSHELEVTSLVLVLIVGAPVVLLVARRDGLFQARVFRRLQALDRT